MKTSACPNILKGSERRIIFLPSPVQSQPNDHSIRSFLFLPDLLCNHKLVFDLFLESFTSVSIRTRPYENYPTHFTYLSTLPGSFSFCSFYKCFHAPQIQPSRIHLLLAVRAQLCAENCMWKTKLYGPRKFSRQKTMAVAYLPKKEQKQGREIFYSIITA